MKALRQFRLLLWKNFILQIRRPIGTIVELLLPIGLISLLILARENIDQEDNCFQSFKPQTPVSSQSSSQKCVMYINGKCVDSGIMNVINGTSQGNTTATNQTSVLSKVPLLASNALSITSCNFEGDFMTLPFELRKIKKLVLAYYPHNNVTKLVMDRFSTLFGEVLRQEGITELKLQWLGSKNQSWSSEEEVAEEVAEEDPKSHLGAVIFTNIGDTDVKLPKIVKYTFRMHPSVTNGYSWNTDRALPFYDGPEARTDNRYECRVMGIMQALETSVILLQANKSELPSFTMQQFTHPEYSVNIFMLIINFVLALIFTMAFVYSAVMITKELVVEKQTRMKESMRMMGLGNWVHWCAWFTKNYLFLLVPVLIMVIILKVCRIFEFTDASVTLVFLLLYLAASIMFCFFMSTWFSNPNLCTLIVSSTWFGTVAPYLQYTDDSSYAKLDVATKLAMCLLPNSCLGVATKHLSFYEISQVGIQWSNIDSIRSGDDTFKFSYTLVMLVADCLIYGILTWYIETAFPGKYGIGKPFYFPFMPSYWCGTGSSASKAEDVIEMNPMVNEKLDKAAYENEPANMEIGVSIQSLRKVFKGSVGKKVAVDGLTLNMFKGQITSLLGHNGAGKTTTMSILTGLYPQSSGQAYVNGHNTRTDMEHIRDSLGICPQHNVLFDRLSVKEHLMFFTNLKGKYGAEAELEVNQMITDIQLADKTDWQSHTLSGGMKRKLSCAIALVGGSQTVILDEPTSGMDPYARRATWDLLLKYKEGKTMVLTTHFMDEADFLGDRIAIMADGQLRCCGSSLFLKSRYGIGYHMILVKAAGCNEENIKNVILRHVPEAKMLSSVGAELEYILRNEDSGLFEQLFVELENNKEQLGIASFGISVTTLEEVFMKVGEGSDKTVEDMMSDHERAEGEQHNTTEECTDDFTSKLELNNGVSLLCQQFGAMFKKRFLHSKRDKKAIGLQLLLPVLMVLLGLILYDTGFKITDDPSRELKLSNLASSGLSLEAFYADFSKSSNSTFYKHTESFMSSMEVKVVDVKAEVKKVQEDNSYFKIQVEDKQYNSSNVQNCCQYKHYVLNQHCKDAFANDSSLCKDSSVFGYYKCKEKADCDKTTDINETDSCLGQIKYLTPLDNPNIAFAEYVVDESNPKEYYLNHVAGFVITNGTNGSQHTHIWYSNEALHTVPEILNSYNNILLRTLMNSDAYGIEATNFPLPRTLASQAWAAAVNGATLSLVIFVLFGMGFLASSFIIFLVQERTSKAKHIQMVSGVNSFCFWMATYCWDFINYLGPALAFLILFACFDIEEFSDNLGLVFLLLVLTGWAVLPFVYCLSFLFKNAVIGFALTTLFFSLGSLTMFLAVFICNLIDDLKEDAKTMHYIFSIIPTYNLPTALTDISTNYGLRKTCSESALQCEVTGVKDQIRDYLDWERPGIGQSCLYLFLDGVVFFILCMLIERGFFCGARIKAAIEHKVYKNLNVAKGVEDEDVASERERVHTLSNYDEDVVVIKDMTKVYRNSKGKVAVNGMNLGMPKGECFGLLGVNGAGKTTSFNMLTGDVSITAGTAYLKGYNIQTHLSEVQQYLGYCPQFDALIERMTGREIIHMYANLRGVPKDRIDDVVNQAIKHINLDKWADKLSGDYSGGNKRKLSTAVALVGDPPIVFLDEPTTGMDPVARRFLWDSLIGVMKGGRSIILTSHSMEECEALCTRLAIMVNGQFKCLGGTQHLKSRFGKGYTMMIKAEPLVQSYAAPSQVSATVASPSSTGGKTEQPSGLPEVQTDPVPPYNEAPPPYTATLTPVNEPEAPPTQEPAALTQEPVTNGTVIANYEGMNNMYLNQPPMTVLYNNTQHVKDFVQRTFPGAVLQDEHQGMLHYQVTDDRLSWSYIFGQLERNRAALNIIDYSVSQTTLEQVFLNFAKEQHVEEERKTGCGCWGR